MKEAVTKVIDMLTQEDFDGVFQKLLIVDTIFCLLFSSSIDWLIDFKGMSTSLVLFYA